MASSTNHRESTSLQKTLIVRLQRVQRSRCSVITQYRNIKNTSWRKTRIGIVINMGVMNFYCKFDRTIWDSVLLR